MFKAQSTEENNQTRCAMENSGKKSKECLAGRFRSFAFRFLMEFLESVAQRQHCQQTLFIKIVCCETSAVSERQKTLKKC